MNDFVDTFKIIAGPCTIESYDKLYATAKVLKELGIEYLRGGAYKMRTTCESFQGLQDEGIMIISEVGEKLGMKTVSEVTQIDKIQFMSEHIDVLTVGARNMHNYPLLRALSNVDNPIILKRGISATYKEWIEAANYIKQNGKANIVLCERGIRTFEQETRFTLDLSAVPVLKTNYTMPVIVDPSHAAGDRRFVVALAKAAIASGAMGLMIECDLDPDNSICDAKQTIAIEQLQDIISFSESFKEVNQ
ncbi:MAG: 3-deoxy-7-phosphoheptulonate synthase [Candidatus Cloacimonetes bacterium]|jgi:3-deoxy-7-phosphoheptulonate synthase|nr:3-deoxy-7-phosphoheptulonate synthase [Candidatus Cloacimonadota bacterium]NLO44738.1 3-deoxy-7-phosphoheptulonate synthase [Candidatus Cloacimonadota bacterium]